MFLKIEIDFDIEKMIRQEFVENLILLLIMGANFGCLENSFMQKHEHFNMWLHLIHCFTLSKFSKRLELIERLMNHTFFLFFLSLKSPKLRQN